MLLLQIFAFIICVYSYSNNECVTSKKYDYIVVGAGTAGSIVASQLSKDRKNDVLLIEEGGWSSEWDIIDNAATFLETWSEPQIERGYFSIPQRNLNNRIIHLSRGRISGGTNSLNANIYRLGQRKDFDERWNVDGWKWNDLKIYWQYIENTFISTLFNKNEEWMSRFIEAGEEIGYIFNPDINDISNNPSSGVYVKHVAGKQISDIYAQRETSWTAYIEPILGSRDNLDIIIYTRVNKVLFHKSNKKAIGVETYGIGDKKIYQFRARKEVILSAGAYDSPKILMLSGIGNCEYLDSLNIECIANVPGVGQNLQDHMGTVLFSPPLLDQNTNFPLQSELWGSVYGANVMKEEGEWDNNVDLGRIPPHFTTKSFQSITGIYQLESRGKVLLQDSDPSSLPIIDHNYLDSMNDAIKWVKAINETRKLWYSDTLKGFIYPQQFEVFPGFDVQTDEEIIEWVKNTDTVGTAFHPSSTCKMGTRFTRNNLNDIVVNNELKVRGICNLRVIDASIIPNQVSANPNNIIMIIAFKASSIILDDH